MLMLHRLRRKRSFAKNGFVVYSSVPRNRDALPYRLRIQEQAASLLYGRNPQNSINAVGPPMYPTSTDSCSPMQINLSMVSCSLQWMRPGAMIPHAQMSVEP